MSKLSEHIRIVEDYYQRYAAEKKRIEDEGRKLIEELDDRVYERRQSPTNPSLTNVFIKDRAAYEEMMRLVRNLADELKAWEEANKPKVTPLDTPQRLVKWIDSQALILNAAQRVGTGKLVEVHLKLYHDARDRALAFHSLVPDVRKQLKIESDAVAGLQDIRSWAEQVACEAEAPPAAEGSDKDTRGEDDELPMLSDYDILILHHLNKPLQMSVQEDIAASANLSRGTVGKSLNDLRNHGLVHYPKGERKGAAITDRGRLALSKLPQERINSLT